MLFFFTILNCSQEPFEIKDYPESMQTIDILNNSRGNYLEYNGDPIKWPTANITYKFIGDQGYMKRRVPVSDEYVKKYFYEAFNKWDNASDYITITETTGNANIEIYNTNTSDRHPGWTTFSHDGNKLKKAKIYINSPYLPVYKLKGIKHLFLHEIGHALGFAHEHSRKEASNNWNESEYGIPHGFYDKSSVMSYENDNTNLSTGDKEAINFLYAPKWNKISGNLEQISVGADGEIWGIQNDYDIYRWRGDGWDKIPGSLKQISVGADGEIWGVQNDYDIYRWRGDGWDKIPGSLKQISVGANGEIWGVQNDYNIYRWRGDGWDKIPGSLKQISVGADGEVWGVQNDCDIYRWRGNGWDKIQGSLKQISVGSDGEVWGVQRDYDIYRWRGDGWDKIPGNLEQISVGSDGKVWGVQRDNEIYKYIYTPLNQL